MMLVSVRAPFPVAIALLFTWFGGPITAQAEVRLPGVFADHMVLQRDAPVPVWGWAKPGEEVSVKIGQQAKQATADQSGKWVVRLDAMSAGGPLVLTVAGDNSIAVKDVMVGEVWLCSGQSNMAMTVARAKDFPQESQQADYPQIRMFRTAALATAQVQTDCQGQWSVCGSQTVGSFSATAYFFGRTLHHQLNVPIGLINSSWGGTDIAAWTSLPAQEAVSEIAPKLEQYEEQIAQFDAPQAQADYEAALQVWKQRAEIAKKEGKRVPRQPRPIVDPRASQNRPGNLFNGMISPLIPYGIRGAIWYQGERNSRNVTDGILYNTQLKTMIEDWRTRWGQGDFAFITVQLPNYQAPQQQPVETSGWVLLREAQLHSLRLPNTGIAITTDVGEANDIHPKNKQAVGERLALWALGTTYEQNIVYCGPIFSSYELRAGRTTANGRMRPGSVKVLFLHAGDELKSSDGGPIRGFAVAGQDRKFYAADATLDDTGAVVLSSDKVASPIAVRYGWAANPICNLVNSAGLPASPFRTDRWDVTKE